MSAQNCSLFFGIKFVQSISALLVFLLFIYNFYLQFDIFYSLEIQIFIKLITTGFERLLRQNLAIKKVKKFYCFLVKIFVIKKQILCARKSCAEK